MTKPTYEELLAALFGVTQALRNTLLLAGNMTGAEKDQRWTITHNAEFMCDAGGHTHYRRAAPHRPHEEAFAHRDVAAAPLGIAARPGAVP